MRIYPTNSELFSTHSLLRDLLEVLITVCALALLFPIKRTFLFLVHCTTYHAVHCVVSFPNDIRTFFSRISLLRTKREHGPSATPTIFLYIYMAGAKDDK